jgi:Tol biopolymer transport system component
MAAFITEIGMILGTAAYMSPEQAAGKRLDKRTDIWSFGVLLWELVTGKRLFEGESTSHMLADVLRGPIDFDKISAAIPPAIRRLLRRCLDRDPKRRLRDIGEARIAIESALQHSEPVETPSNSKPLFAWLVASALACALGAMAFVHFREIPPARQHLRFRIDPPEGKLINFAISPDGRFLALEMLEKATAIWIRSLDSLDAKLLANVDDTNNLLLWSRDGENIAFQAGKKLYRIPRSGGPPTFLADAPDSIQEGVWLDGGDILFATRSGLFWVPSSGGAAVKLEESGAEQLGWLPGRRFLYSLKDGMYAGSLDGTKPARILPDRTAAIYEMPLMPGNPGHLLYVRGGDLLAQPFDARDLALRGDAVSLGVHGVDKFDSSENGVLVFGNLNSVDAVLAWVDRSGKKLREVTRPFSTFEGPMFSLSPDDSQVIVPISGADGSDLWIADINQGKLSRFTFNGASQGVWSPDGKKVLWGGENENRYLKAADGSARDDLMFKSPNGPGCAIYGWSSDGKFIAICVEGKKSAWDIWLVPVEGDSKPYPFIQSDFAVYWAQISPDNRWMAYVSEQTPQPQQVFVESIPTGKGKWQVSTEGGDWPVWRRDGKELFYYEGTKVMAVTTELNGTAVKFGKPQELFDEKTTGYMHGRFQVSQDGKRFLVALRPAGISASTPLTVDTDWRAGLAK